MGFTHPIGQFINDPRILFSCNHGQIEIIVGNNWVCYHDTNYFLFWYKGMLRTRSTLSKKCTRDPTKINRYIENILYLVFIFSAS